MLLKMPRGRLLLVQKSASLWMPRRMHSNETRTSGMASRAGTAITKGFFQFLGQITPICAAGGLFYMMIVRRQEEEDQRPVRQIITSQVPAIVGDFIERPVLFQNLQRLILDPDENMDFFVLITGNHKVGKSHLVQRVLQGHQGVFRVTLQDGQTIDSALHGVLGVENDAAMVWAFAEAGKQLGHRPVLLIDIQERVTDTKTLNSISNFCKEFGFEMKLAKVVVTASSAGTASFITGDDRRVDFFVPCFSLEELKKEKAQISKWYGKPVEDTDIDAVFNLTGGVVGDIEATFKQARNTGLPKALSDMKRKVQRDLQNYQCIDCSGGFGPGKVCLATWLAHQVAKSSFQQCFSSFELPFNPSQFGVTVRNLRAHPIYFDPNSSAYCARSPFVHRELGSIKSAENLMKAARV
mmetsp:Transcript_36104/g.78097  ORF Transcript_36104/g.78097 Transcript_36104/m.78097 type:complete len:410 (-) Transcript_36104:430-1659(-)